MTTENPLLKFLNTDPKAPIEKKNDMHTFFRLMAEENITIIEGPYKTASADIENRVMRIPDYSNESSALRVLFGAHEVGHFRWTPKELLHEIVENSELPKGLFPCVNIIEDIRIEKKIRQKFPGLIKEFKTAYQELLTRNFFGNVGEKSGFINKVNVKSKTGADAGFEFDGKDLAVYKYLLNTHEADEVIKKAKFLYIYAKESDELNNAKDEQEGSGEPGDGSGDDELTFDDDLEIEFSDEDGDSSTSGKSVPSGGKISKIKISKSKNPGKSGQSLPADIVKKINDKINSLPDSYFEDVLKDSNSNETLDKNMDSLKNLSYKEPATLSKSSLTMQKVKRFKL